MDADRIKGVGKQVSGSIKEAIGKITGDRSTETEGTVEKSTGEDQNAVGSVKDKARDVIND